MSIFQRHSWSFIFSHWLTDNGFPYNTATLRRSHGDANILMMGHLTDDNRETIVFLHGLGNDLFFPNINFFKSLLLSGFNIVTCDLDGHGHGQSTLFSPDTISTLLSDIVSHCDNFSSGRAQLHICGYSFGAVLALQFASSRPDRTKSLSLIGMPYNLKTKLGFVMEGLTPFCKSYRQSLGTYGLIGIQPAIGPIRRTRYPVRLPPEESGSYFSVAARAIAQINPEHLLKTAQIPALIIYGQHDFIAHRPATDEFPKEIKHRTIRLTGETHFTSMLSHEMSRAVCHWLRTST